MNQNLQSVLTIAGGIGLFLYGMKLLGQSLERFAGAKIEKTLEKLTSNKGKAVLLGAGVTAVIQSSSATIIMVIGFLNAGILKLAQAVPVIFGANIGTTITAQILRLEEVGRGNILTQMLRPSSFAPVCIVIGAFVMLVAKRNRTKYKAGIAVGLGIIFIGMGMMESGFKPLAQTEAFIQTFIVIANPVWGVLAGMLVTVILQSSSASVGMLQAMSTTGVITFSVAAPVIIGQNIGKCVTVLLASIGSNKNSKRAAFIDIMISVIGAAIFLAAIYSYQAVIGFGFWDKPTNMGSIANFHTLFNVGTCLCMMPLVHFLISLSKKIIRDKGTSKIDREVALLDPIFLTNPSVAIEQCKKVMDTVADTVTENYDLTTSCLFKYDSSSADKVRENENFLDKTETLLGEYLVKITEHRLMDEDNRLATEFMHTVGDFERIGDHCINFLDVSEFNFEHEVKFSDSGRNELGNLREAVGEAISTTVKAYKHEDESIYSKILPLEDVIDDIVDMLKSRRVIRLQARGCTMASAISYVEVLTNMERISDHCKDIALHLHQRIIKQSLDTHKSEELAKETAEYRKMKAYYEKRYVEPMKKKEE